MSAITQDEFNKDFRQIVNLHGRLSAAIHAEYVEQMLTRMGKTSKTATVTLQTNRDDIEILDHLEQLRTLFKLVPPDLRTQHRYSHLCGKCECRSIDGQNSTGVCDNVALQQQTYIMCRLRTVFALLHFIDDRRDIDEICAEIITEYINEECDDLPLNDY